MATALREPVRPSTVTRITSLATLAVLFGSLFASLATGAFVSATTGIMGGVSFGNGWTETGVFSVTDPSNDESVAGRDLIKFWTALRTLNGGTSAPSGTNPMQYVYFRIDHRDTSANPGQNFNIQLNLGTAPAGQVDHLLMIRPETSFKVALFSYASPYPTAGAFTSGTITQVFQNYDPLVVGTYKTGVLTRTGLWDATKYGWEIGLPIAWLTDAPLSLVEADGSGVSSLLGALFTSTGAWGAVGSDKDKLNDGNGRILTLISNLQTGESTAQPLATKVAFTSQPTNTQVGASIASFTVAIQDATSATVTTASNAVTIAIGTNPGGGTLSGTTTVNAVNGIATFSGLSINALGTGYTLTASSTGLTLATSSTFNIVAGTATKLGFTQQPTSATAGAAISPAITVAVQDAAGNTITSSTASITLAIGTNPGSGTLSGTVTKSAVSGVATFSDLSINKAGTGYTLVATSTPLTSATSSAFNIVAGTTATQIALSGATTDLSSGATRVLTATLQDAFGNTVTSGAHSTLSVTFAKTSGAGTATGLGAATAVAGVAQITVTGAVAGSVSLQASTASPALTSGTLTFNVIAGTTASQIVLSGATGDLSSGTTRVLTATIQDASGNTITSGSDATLSVTFAKTSGAGTVTGLGAATAVAGVAQVTVTGAVAGSITLQASTASPSLTSNGLTFSVIASTTATQIVLSGTTSDLSSGTTRVLTATIQDASGNTVTSGAHSTLSVTFAKSGGAGTVTGLASATAVAGVAQITVTGAVAGSISLQATTSSPSLTSNTLTFGVIASTTAAQIALSGSTSDLASGDTRVLTATIQDAAGNTVVSGSHSTLSVAFAKTSGSGTVTGLGSATAVAGVAQITVTGAVAGSISLQASTSSPAITSNTLTFSVVASQTAASIELSGATTDLSSGSTRLLTATLKDGSGNTVTAGAHSTLSVTFAKSSGAGTVTGLGSATAVAGVAQITVTGAVAGSISFQATTGSPSLTSNTLTFSVIASETAASIDLSGSTSDLMSGTTRVLTATLKDAAGNTVVAGPHATLSVTFAKTSGAGTVTGLGAGTAVAGVAQITVTGAIAGSITFQASTSSPSLTSNSLTFAVIPSTTAASIVLSGSTSDLPAGDTRVLTATLKDAAGNTVVSGSHSTPSVTFSKSSGAGTVTGLGSATAVAGVAQITVTGGSVGSVTLEATTSSPSLTSNSLTLSVVASQTATQITLSGATGDLSSGSTRVLTATIQDSNGNTITAGSHSTLSVTFAKTSGSGTVTGLGSATAVAGIAQITVTGAVAGSISFQATTGSPSLTSNTLTFSVIASTTAAQIVLSGATGSLTSGTTRVLTATIQDAAGNTVVSGSHSTLSVTFAKTGGTGTVSGLGSAAAVAGVAQITVTGILAGSIDLQASTSSPSLTSNTLTFSVIASETATQIAISGSTGDLESGSTRQVTATLQDANGNTVTTGSHSSLLVTFAKAAGAGVVTGLGAVAAVGGIAVITVTGSLVGSVSVHASTSSPALTSSSLTFNVVHGSTAASIALSAATTDLSSGSTRVLTATIKDAAGNTITSGAHSGLSVTFAKTSGAGTLTGLGAATASAGVAQVTVTGVLAGSVSLAASTASPGLTSNTLTFSVIASETAASIALSGSTSDLASGDTRVLTATLKDAAGNTVVAGPHAVLSVGFAKSGGAGTVTGLGSATASAGVAQVTVTGAIAGSISLQASTTSPSLTSNTLTFAVVASQTATQIALSGATTDLNSGSTRVLTATLQDANGNTVTAGAHSTLSVTFAKTSGSGTVTGLSSATAVAGVARITVTGAVAGSLTITASTSSPSLTSGGLTFSVIPSETAASITLSGLSTDLSSGSTRVLTATLKDAAGNTVVAGPHASLSVSFAKSSGAGTVTGLGSAAASAGVAQVTVTGALAGSISLQASTTSPALTSGTLTFSVIPSETAASITLSGLTTDLSSGSTRVLTATLKDAAGNTVVAGPHASLSVTFSKTAGTGTLTGLGSSTAAAGVASLTVTGVLAGSVSLQASIASPSFTSNTLTFSVIPSQAAASIAISGSTGDLTSGTTRQLTATIKDAAGNTIVAGPNATLDVTFAKSAGTGTATGLGVATASAGVATLTITGVLAGSITIQASTSSPSLTHTLTFTIIPSQAAASVALSGSTLDLASGDARSYTATIKDAAGNTITAGPNATASVTFSKTAGAGSLTGLGSAAAVAGVATISLTGGSVGSVTIQAAAAGFQSGTLTFSVVASQTAAGLVLSGATTDLASGSTRVLTATIQDGSGNTVTAGAHSSLVVSFSKTSGTGTVTGLGTATASGGVATITVTGVLVGSATFQASVVSPSLTSGTLTFNIVPGTAAKLVILTQPVGAAANVSYATQPVIEIQDAAGNRVTGSSAAITAAIKTGPGTLLGTVTVNAVNGVATFTNLRSQSAGTITLEFTGTNLASVVSSPLTVTAGPASAAHSTAVVPAGTSGSATSIVVTVKDAFGNIVTGVASQLNGTVSGANTAFTSAYTDNGDGTYTATYTPLVAGTDSVAIKLGGTAISGSPYTSVVSAGAASSLGIQTQPSSSATAGVAFAQQPVVRILDANGNLRTGDSATVVSVVIATGSGTLLGTLTATASSGLATFSGLKTNTAGTITLRFNATGLTSVTSGNIVVGAAAASAANTTASVPAGTSGSLTSIKVTVRDAFGNRVTTACGSLSASVSGANTALIVLWTVNGDGDCVDTYLPTATGTDTIAITLGGTAISGSPYTSVVSSSTPAALALQTQPSSTATAGTAFAQQPAIKVVDGSGNTVTSDSATVVTVSVASGPGAVYGTLTATAVNGIVTFSGLNLRIVGSYTLSFSKTGLTSATSGTVTVSAGAPSAANSTASVPAGTRGSPTTITITARDAYGNLVSTATGLAVSISGNNTATPSVTNAGGGSYTATYTPARTGNDFVAITLNGVAISGSPYTSLVSKQPGITMSHSSTATEVSESGATDTITVVLDRQPLANVVLDLSSSATSAMTLSASSLTFTTANWNVPQTVTVRPVDDVIYDGTQNAVLRAAVNDSLSSNEYDPVADATLSATTLDNDQPVTLTLALDNDRLLPNVTANVTLQAANATGTTVTLLSGACTWNMANSGSSTFVTSAANGCDSHVMKAGPIRGSIYKVSVTVGGVTATKAFWIIAPTAIIVSSDPIVVQNKTTVVEPMTTVNMMPVLVHEDTKPMAKPVMLNMVFLESAENTVKTVTIVTEERTALPTGVPPPKTLINAVYLEIGAWEDGVRPVTMTKVTVRFMVTDAWLATNCPTSSCSLRLYHYTAGAWEVLTPTSLGSNGTRTTYEAFVNSLSPFVIGGQSTGGGGGGGGGPPPQPVPAGPRPKATSPAQPLPDPSVPGGQLPGPGVAQPISAPVVDTSRVLVPMWVFFMVGITTLGAGLAVARPEWVGAGARSLWFIAGGRRRKEEKQAIPVARRGPWGPVLVEQTLWAPILLQIPEPQWVFSANVNRRLADDALRVNRLLAQIKETRLRGQSLDPGTRAKALAELQYLNHQFQALRRLPAAGAPADARPELLAGVPAAALRAEASRFSHAAHALREPHAESNDGELRRRAREEAQRLSKMANAYRTAHADGAPKPRAPSPARPVDERAPADEELRRADANPTPLAQATLQAVKVARLLHRLHDTQLGQDRGLERDVLKEALALNRSFRELHGIRAAPSEWARHLRDAPSKRSSSTPIALATADATKLARIMNRLHDQPKGSRPALEKQMLAQARALNRRFQELHGVSPPAIDWAAELRDAPAVPAEPAARPTEAARGLDPPVLPTQTPAPPAKRIPAAQGTDAHANGRVPSGPARGARIRGLREEPRPASSNGRIPPPSDAKDGASAARSKTRKEAHDDR